MRPPRAGPPLRQAGRSIVELMVSMAIGLAILLGVVALYSSASSGARTAQQLGSVESAANTALRMIGWYAQMAGYGDVNGSQANLSRGQVTFEGDAIRGCANGAFANPAAGDFTCRAGGANDALMLGMQGDLVVGPPQGGLRDCLGGAPVLRTATSPGSAGLALGVIGNAYWVDAGGNLVCLGSGGGAPQPIVSGVEEFKVFYGFDDADFAAAASGLFVNDRRATTVRSAAWLEANRDATLNPWEFVIAVYVCLRVRTQGSVSTTSGALAVEGCPTTPAEADGTAARPSATFTDGVVRRTYSQVFALRNRSSANALQGR